MVTSKAVQKKTNPTNPHTEGKTSADAIDVQLAKYRSMRDFHVTREPSGTAKDGTTAALPFCIQKHAASHLHYDLRLGWNGVLKSWAVAKGPSYFPGDKRLAVQVEDHPMEYGGFEGIIPSGQYGGGTVMLWDQGTWEPQPGHEDLDAGFRSGSLKFLMHGEKIMGKWTLIRMGGKAAQERKPNWLLIKEHDEFEGAVGALEVTEAEPNSVVTGRTMEQIARSEDHVWNSKETAGTGQAWYRSVASGGDGSSESTPLDPPRRKRPRLSMPAKKAASSTGTKVDYSRALADLLKEPQPTFVKPQLALESNSPPKEGGWLHELKMDGYRIQARKSQGKVVLLTRSGLDWTHRVPAVAAAVARLAPKSVTLDGEVVVLGADGTTNFADLQASFQEGATNPLTYFCFDLLHLDGRATRELSLLRRKELLAQVLMSGDNDSVRLSEHIETNGEIMFKKACELHAEGIISKRSEALYTSGRNGDWLKSKCLREQEFVVGGYTLSSDGEDRIGSLLLGYYLEGKLIYAGRTGTGFTQKTRRALLQQLRPMQLVEFAYASVPAEAKRGALWVKPEVVAQVRFATWTAEDLVRQAAFLGIREDKKASEVRREAATVAPKPKSGKATAVAAKRTSGKTPNAPKTENDFTVTQRKTSTTRAKVAAVSETTPVAGAIVWPAMSNPPVRLTHPAKVLDTTSGVTKQMLAEYLWAVADRMLPHITDRPLSLVRCPEGSAKPCFYQKHINHMLPPGVNAVDVPDKKTGVIESYITLGSKEALAGLAQMGVLEVHPWGSTNGDLEHADRVIFDLDPDESLAWRDVTMAADDVRKRLKARGLTSFLKTTGGKGLHVVVPTEPKFDWTEVKEWTRAFVLDMERAAPTKYLSKMTKAARTGRIYLDYLRNERGATAVAPYSSRAREGLGVSMPLAWRELHTSHRPVYRVDGFPEWKPRLKQDPWAKMETIHQSLR